jgi:hypothetical protein
LCTKNPSDAPATINENIEAFRLASSIIPNLRDAIPMIIADIAAIPGIWPSTPLLQFNIFITQTIHPTASKDDKESTIGMPKTVISIALKYKIPPSGFVINGIVIPELTTMSADTIFIPNRRYGERSYLSSNKPTTTTRNPAIATERKVLSMGRNVLMVITIARYIGSPPPRGIIFE